MEDFRISRLQHLASFLNRGNDRPYWAWSKEHMNKMEKSLLEYKKLKHELESSGWTIKERTK